jgi:hypothetical protein
MKTETLYSRADWKFHKGRLGYDDVVDGHGRLVATVNVMDIAADEMLRESFLADEPPREIFVRDADRSWSVYLSVTWLTPKTVQAALDKLGKLLGRAFCFEPYRLPPKLTARYRQQERAMREGIRQSKLVPWSTVERTLGKGQVTKRRPNRKRLAALLSQKLKS